MKYFAASELMISPTDRPAFSDRRAYMCAELARLAYFKFEGGYQIVEILNAIEEFTGREVPPGLEQKLSVLAYDQSPMSGEEALRRILSIANFDLKKTFSKRGTQAFVCTRQEKKKTIAFVVFRGTEKNSIKDIIYDIKLNTVKTFLGDSSSVEVHQGFLEALENIEDDLAKSLKGIKFDQVFITGHSLGGALAALATAKFASDLDGACYTFGAPPIGTSNISDALKTPVYGIINGLDIVPRIINPFTGWALVGIIQALRYLSSVFAFLGFLTAGKWDENLEKWCKGMIKYKHPGYLSYLCGKGKKSRLRYNVTIFDRFKWWTGAKVRKSFKKSLGDHSIKSYVEKLREHGLQRNPLIPRHNAFIVEKHRSNEEISPNKPLNIINENKRPEL